MKRTARYRGALLGAAAIVTGAYSGAPALAQEQAAPAAPADRIVVTAERRESGVQETPIAVSILDAEILREKNVEQMSDLQFATPSMTVNDGALSEGVNIRGIGLTSGSPRSAPGVATYRDGVLVPAILNQTGFFDIGSVEVLRGPQGTFAGSYSTGGAIYLNSRDPDLGDVNGYLTAGVGDYGLLRTAGAVNLPAGETFAVRGAFQAQQRGSYYDFINGGQGDVEPGGLEEIAGRVSVLWAPTAAFSGVLKLEGVDRKAGGRDYRPRPGSTYAPLAPVDQRTLDFDTVQHVNEEAGRASLRLDFEMPSGLVLRSTTGGNISKADNLDDADGVAGTLGPTALGSEMHQFVDERTVSQELNLISPESDRFSWVLGAYIFESDIDVDIDIRNSPSGGHAQTLDIDLNTLKGNYGVFAHGRYDLTPSLEAELGVRYSRSFTSDNGSVRILNVFGPGVDLVQASDGRHADDAVTGKAGLNWTVDENNFLFAFVARGFKPGTVNSSSAVLAPAFLANPGVPGAQVEPEKVTDYEAGWRGTMLDGALLTQVGVFYADYRNFQIDTIDLATGQGGMVNADSATLYGAEAQAQLSIDDFRADIGVAYLHSKVDNAVLVDTSLGLGPPPGAPLPQCQPSTGPAGTPGPGCWNYATFNVAGNEMQNAPEFTLTVGAEYDFRVGDGVLTPRINYSYIGSQWGSLQNLPEDELGSRAVMDLSLGYEQGDWRARAFVSNVTDELYISGLFGTLQFYGPPRTFGFELTKAF